MTVTVCSCCLRKGVRWQNGWSIWSICFLNPPPLTRNVRLPQTASAVAYHVQSVDSFMLYLCPCGTRSELDRGLGETFIPGLNVKPLMVTWSYKCPPPVVKLRSSSFIKPPPHPTLLSFSLPLTSGPPSLSAYPEFHVLYWSVRQGSIQMHVF